MLLHLLYVLLLPPGACPGGSYAETLPHSVTQATPHLFCSLLACLPCRFHTHLNTGPLNRKEGLKSCPDTNPSREEKKNKQPLFLSWKIFFLCWIIFQVYKFELWSNFAVSVCILNKEIACSLSPCFIQMNRGCNKQHFLEKQHIAQGSKIKVRGGWTVLNLRPSHQCLQYFILQMCWVFFPVAG